MSEQRTSPPRSAESVRRVEQAIRDFLELDPGLARFVIATNPDLVARARRVLGIEGTPAVEERDGRLCRTALDANGEVKSVTTIPVDASIATSTDPGDGVDRWITTVPRTAELELAAALERARLAGAFSCPFSPSLEARLLLAGWAADHDRARLCRTPWCDNNDPMPEEEPVRPGFVGMVKGGEETDLGRRCKDIVRGREDGAA